MVLHMKEDKWLALLDDIFNGGFMNQVSFRSNTASIIEIDKNEL